MAFEQRENSGTLFKNDKKEEAKHPDYKGEALVNGVQCWISAWIKEGKSGKFMSLAFSPKESRGGQRSRPAAQSDDDEGAPF